MLGHTWHLLRIIWVGLRFGLYEVVFVLPVLCYFSGLLPLLNRLTGAYRYSRGEKIRLALEALGPSFIKLGQAVSTRRDLVPIDIIDELSKLQDQVPPFPSAEAIKILEKAYQKPLKDIFIRFDESPLAAASIAQVHTARLFSHEEVVVKIVRPNIEKIILRDIKLMKTVARLMNRYWKEAKRLRLNEVVSEYEKTILNELDLTLEAANGTQLRRNFENSEELYVPEIYWDYVRKNVLVMERIYGISIGKIDELKAAGVNMKLLAERAVDIFFTQVFHHSFFHADMHPGNIFVDVSNPLSPRYIALDFGIIGTLSPSDQRYLADNFLAFFNRDYRRVAELHLESGWVPSTTSVDEFESAIRSLCEPIFNKPLKEISFGGFLFSLFQTARRFQMEVQPQLILLQKTLLAIEGVGRELYPDLDLWQTARPFLMQFVKDKSGPCATFKRYQHDFPYWISQLPDLMQQSHLAARKVAEGKIEIAFPESEWLKWQAFQQHQRRRYIQTTIASVLLISGLYTVLGLSQLQSGSAFIILSSLFYYWAWRD